MVFLMTDSLNCLDVIFHFHIFHKSFSLEANVKLLQLQILPLQQWQWHCNRGQFSWFKNTAELSLEFTSINIFLTIFHIKYCDISSNRKPLIKGEIDYILKPDCIALVCRDNSDTAKTLRHCGITVSGGSLLLQI